MQRICKSLTIYFWKYIIYIRGISNLLLVFRTRISLVFAGIFRNVLNCYVNQEMRRSISIAFDKRRMSAIYHLDSLPSILTSFQSGNRGKSRRSQIGISCGEWEKVTRTPRNASSSWRNYRSSKSRLSISSTEPAGSALRYRSPTVTGTRRGPMVRREPVDWSIATQLTR